MPAADVKTTVTELPESRVRVEAQVSAEEVERRLQQTARALGRDMRMPGFRKGKVPAPVVIRRVGREAILDETVRDSLPNWYVDAIDAAGIHPVGDPSLQLGELPDEGQPLTFTIEIGVRPIAQLGTYKGVEVGRRELSVNPDEVQAELERTREALASLENVDREARSGDFVVIDFNGTIDGEPFQGGEGRGQVVELGSGRLVPGFEEQLEGVRAGDRREVRITFPEDYSVEELAGRAAVFAVEVKEVKEKRLPELDDDFAAEAGGFDTLDELRSDIDSRLREAHDRAIEAEFREAAVDAVVAQARIEVPHELVHSKAHEMWHRTARRMSAQGVDPRRYLELSGKTEEELVTESEPDAELALKREAVLAEIVKAEGIEVSDEEVTNALREAAGPDATDKQVKRALKRARSQGADEALREDIAMRKAVDLLVEHAKPIPAEQAAARERLWTPEKEQEQGAGQIWTPGS